MHRGGCLCGAVRFEISGALPPIQICHCGQCRRAQGSAFAANIPVRVESLRFISGLQGLREYESSPGKLRAFCSNCGSPLYSRRVDLPDTRRIRAGSLDTPVHARPVAHFHTASKADWFEICDALPQFAAGDVAKN